MSAIVRYKKSNNLSYTLGMTLTIELLKCKPSIVEKVFVSSSIDENQNTELLRQLCQKNNISLEKNDKAFNVLSPKGNCFVIGVFQKFQSPVDNADHILLVNPSDSGNLGSIVRTAVGFGLNNLGVVLPSVDIFDPKTVRASMGALFHTNFECFDSIEAYRKKFVGHNLYAFMLDAKKSLADEKFQKPFSLVFGNEATGLPPNYKDFCNTVVIPHSKEIDSLNLTTAASIAIYSATLSKWNN